MRLLLDESVPVKLRRSLPNLPFQQNLSALPIALVVLDALSNELAYLEPLLPAMERALTLLKPRTYVRIQAGHSLQP
jgi:hypothetical protein